MTYDIRLMLKDLSLLLHISFSLAQFDFIRPCEKECVSRTCYTAHFWL